MKLFYSLTLILISTFLYAETSNFSQYTSLEYKDCIKQQLNAEEIGYSCPSFSALELSIVEYGAMALFVTRKGVRSYLDVETPKGALGKKLEWRYARKLKKHHDEVSLVALIFRAGSSEGSQLSSDSNLYVVKITPKEICLVAKVPSQAKQNDQARKIADNSSGLKCMFDQSPEGDY